MLALATIWYSPMLFGKLWMKETNITQEMVEAAEADTWKHMLITFVSYVVMLGLLALMVAVAPKVSLTPVQAAVLLSVFVSAGSVSTTLFEGRSARYFFIQSGFHVVFIFVGTLMLQYWPW
jgi:hypothetical protein